MNVDDVFGSDPSDSSDSSAESLEPTVQETQSLESSTLEKPAVAETKMPTVAAEPKVQSPEPSEEPFISETLIDNFLMSPGVAFGKVYAILTYDASKHSDVPGEDVEEIRSLGMDAFETLVREWEGAALGLTADEMVTEDGAESELLMERRHEHQALIQMTSSYPDAAVGLGRVLRDREKLQAYYNALPDDPTDQQRLDTLGLGVGARAKQ